MFLASNQNCWASNHCPYCKIWEERSQKKNNLRREDENQRFWSPKESWKVRVNKAAGAARSSRALSGVSAARWIVKQWRREYREKICKGCTSGFAKIRKMDLWEGMRLWLFRRKATWLHRNSADTQKPNPYAETCMSLFPFLATVVCKKDITTRERPTWLYEYRGFIRANWVVAYHTPSEEDIVKRVCLWFRLKWICGKACGYDFGMRLWLCRRKNIAHVSLSLVISFAVKGCEKDIKGQERDMHVSAYGFLGVSRITMQPCASIFTSYEQTEWLRLTLQLSGFNNKASINFVWWSF